MACWWSAERWLHHVELVYRRHYLVLRPALVASTGGGLSLRAVRAVAAAHAAAADYRTGRASRPVVGDTGGSTGITAATGLGARTITRARTFLRLAGLATEVAPGRHRTYLERMDSWRRGDTARGWAADWALHPSTTHPIHTHPSTPGAVDNLGIITAGQNPDGTPPHRGIFLSFPPENHMVSTKQQPKRRGATRPATIKRGQSRRRTTPDPRGLLLATRWARNPNSPSWVKTLPPGVWAALLALPARHGWTDRDLNQLLTDHHTSGRAIPTRPQRPIGFLSWVLTRHGNLDDRPCALDDARHAEELAAAKRRKAEQAAASRQFAAERLIAQAALGGPGHTAARAAAARHTNRRAAPDLG